MQWIKIMQFQNTDYFKANAKNICFNYSQIFLKVFLISKFYSVHFLRAYTLRKLFFINVSFYRLYIKNIRV